MPDVDRATITKAVYKRLADHRFRERLTATAPDGTRPIIVALRNDPLQGLLDKLDRAGGAGNVVVPALNGFLVVTMTREPYTEAEADELDPHVLTRDCTVGVFVEGLHIYEEHARYRFGVQDGPRKEAGRAEVVALAG